MSDDPKLYCLAVQYITPIIFRLEEQHKSEIERYRSELIVKERDFQELRHQIAENRKSEVHLFMRELQIKDNKLADEIEV